MFSMQANLRTAFTELQNWGFSDAILPFLLFFAILFAILQKIKLFKDGDDADRKLNAIIAFVISAMIVVPHILGTIPRSMDPVVIMYNILPASAIIIVTLAVVMILMGLTEYKTGAPLLLALGLGSIALIVYLFITNMFPNIGLNPIIKDPKLQSLVIVLLVFGLIVWFIMRSPGEKDKSTPKVNLLKQLFGMEGGK